jgi:hypothetical protein
VKFAMRNPKGQRRWYWIETGCIWKMYFQEAGLDTWRHPSMEREIPSQVLEWSSVHPMP